MGIRRQVQRKDKGEEPWTSAFPSSSPPPQPSSLPAFQLSRPAFHLSTSAFQPSSLPAQPSSLPAQSPTLPAQPPSVPAQPSIQYSPPKLSLGDDPHAIVGGFGDIECSTVPGLYGEEPRPRPHKMASKRQDGDDAWLRSDHVLVCSKQSSPAPHRHSVSGLHA